jgi:hypothetical protein
VLVGTPEIEAVLPKDVTSSTGAHDPTPPRQQSGSNLREIAALDMRGLDAW